MRGESGGQIRPPPSRNSDSAVPGTHRAKGPLFALGGRTSVRGETVPPGRAGQAKSWPRPRARHRRQHAQLWPRWQWLRPTTVCLANRWRSWKAWSVARGNPSALSRSVEGEPLRLIREPSTARRPAAAVAGRAADHRARRHSRCRARGIRAASMDHGAGFRSETRSACGAGHFVRCPCWPPP